MKLNILKGVKDNLGTLPTDNPNNVYVTTDDGEIYLGNKIWKAISTEVTAHRQAYIKETDGTNILVDLTSENMIPDGFSYTLLRNPVGPNQDKVLVASWDGTFSLQPPLITGFTDPNHTSLGEGMSVNGYGGTGIGIGSNADGWHSVALGIYCKAPTQYSIAIGDTAECVPNECISIGYFAKCDENADGSIALGEHSYTDEPDVLSIGSDSKKRRITNMADGINPTDGATKNQVDNIQLAFSPHLWEFATEYDLGDGSYGQRFENDPSFSLPLGTSSTTVEIASDIIIDNIILMGGYYQVDFGEPAGLIVKYIIGQYYSPDNYTSIIYTNFNGIGDKGLHLNITDSSSSNMGDITTFKFSYDVWIRYTKSAIAQANTAIIGGNKITPDPVIKNDSITNPS